MHRQSASRSQAAGPSVASIIDADGSAAADRIRFAKKSRCFADEAGVTQKQFPKWLDESNARPELSCSLLWLQTLLPGEGEEALLRSGIANLDRLLTGPVQPQVEELFELHGVVKRHLLALCERLEADPQKSTAAAVCRELRPVFGAARGLGMLDAKAIGGAIERAVSTVEGQSCTDTRRFAAETLPKTSDAALATILAGLGAEGVRQLYVRLSASFDRLITFLPKAKNASLKNRLIGMMPRERNTSLKGRLIAWRDRYATPPTRLGGQHAEMLYGGHLELTALCNVLEKLESDKRKVVFEILARKVPDGNKVGSQVTGLVNVFVEAEGLLDEADNPHLEERRSLLERSPLLMGLTAAEEEVSDLMVGLGFELDWAVNGASSTMHPVRNNAAWRMCLENAVAPIDDHPLADVTFLHDVAKIEDLAGRAARLR